MICEPPFRVMDYLSGRHDFHLDTLLKLEKHLGIRLLDLNISEEDK